MSGSTAVHTQSNSDNYLFNTRGFLSWALTLDHKRIGMMYLVGVMSAFFIGGILALVLRAELVDAENWFLTNKQYNQVFTLHGAVMVFLFIIPSVPAALGNFLVPVMLGAKDVAFPRLNLCSFYLWVIGAGFLFSRSAVDRIGYRLDFLHALQYANYWACGCGNYGCVYPRV